MYFDYELKLEDRFLSRMMVSVQILLELIICLFVIELASLSSNPDTNSRLLELVARRDRRSGHGGATAQRERKKLNMQSNSPECEDKDQIELEELTRLMENLSAKLAELHGRLQIAKKCDHEPNILFNSYNELTKPSKSHYLTK